MNIRDILIIFLHISLGNVFGKSLKHVVHNDAELASKHHIDESKRNFRLRRTSEKSPGHNAKAPSDAKKYFNKSLNSTVFIAADDDKVDKGNAKTIKNGDTGDSDCTQNNCNIVFENAGDDGINLMEEEKEEEEEEAKLKARAITANSTVLKFQDLSNNGLNEDEGSGEDDLVEPDKPIGTENAQHTKKLHKANETVSLLSRSVSKGKAEVKNKDKQVVLMPQSSVQEGTKSQVNNISDAAKYPSLPIPQMIPLPLFYNSGEREGSAGHLASSTKKTKGVDEFNGESGFGEVALHDRQNQSAKNYLLLNGEDDTGKAVTGIGEKGKKAKSEVAGKINHAHGNKSFSGQKTEGKKIKPPEMKMIHKTKSVDRAALVDLDWDLGKNIKPMLEKKVNKSRSNDRAPKDLDFHLGERVKEKDAIKPNNLPIEVVEYKFDEGKDTKPMLEKKVNNSRINDKAPKDLDFHLETKTDQPFAAPVGQKGNIHSTGNTGVQIAEDHDEVVLAGDDADSSKDTSSGDSEKKESDNGSGEPKANPIPIKVLGQKTVSDTDESDEPAQEDEPEGPEEHKDAESSASGSGEVTPEFSSGDTDSQNIRRPSKGEASEILSDAEMGADDQLKDNEKSGFKEEKERWIVHNVKVNQDINAILNQFNQAQPGYAATALAPQVLPQPAELYGVPFQPHIQAETRTAELPPPPLQAAQTAVPAPPTQPNIASQFLKQGILGALNTHPGVAAQAAAYNAAIEHNQNNMCVAPCPGSCSPHCDPQCCMAAYHAPPPSMNMCVASCPAACSPRCEASCCMPPSEEAPPSAQDALVEVVDITEQVKPIAEHLDKVLAGMGIKPAKPAPTNQAGAVPGNGRPAPSSYNIPSQTPPGHPLGQVQVPYQYPPQIPAQTQPLPPLQYNLQYPQQQNQPWPNRNQPYANANNQLWNQQAAHLYNGQNQNQLWNQQNSRLYNGQNPNHPYANVNNQSWLSPQQNLSPLTTLTQNQPLTKTITQPSQQQNSHLSNTLTQNQALTSTNTQLSQQQNSHLSNQLPQNQALTNTNTQPSQQQNSHLSNPLTQTQLFANTNIPPSQQENSHLTNPLTQNQPLATTDDQETPEGTPDDNTPTEPDVSDQAQPDTQADASVTAPSEQLAPLNTDQEQNMFFKKTHDPNSNLEAYKQQTHKKFENVDDD